MKYWITPSDHPRNGKVGFHDFDYDSKLNSLVGVLGPMIYIVDPKTGFPTTKGYHEIRWSPLYFIGRLGAKEENVTDYSPDEGLAKFEANIEE